MNSAVRAGFLFRRLHRCVFRQIERRVLALPLLNFHTLLIQRDCHASVGNLEITDIPDIKDLTQGDPTLEKKLKVIILEMDIWRQEGERVPTQLKPADWKELISLESRSARKKYLLFIWKKEMTKSNEKRKKELKRIDREKLDIPVRDRDAYGLGGNTIFMRIRESTMTNYLNGKLIEAMQFGQELVVDCGYDQYMTRREAKNCAKQLMLLFSDNRMHINPFNLYFCNARKESESIKEFGKLLCIPFEPHFPLNITEKSYLDLFPKQNLVYLTPHCREELLHYDHNAVYIIGAMVDKVHNEPLSLARAKEQGLKMAKLPLDRYLSWGSGSGKSLTLNQMIMILLDLKLSGDWSKALKHVPSRKIMKVYQVDSSAKQFKLNKSKDEKSSPKDFYNQLLLKKMKK
ncbi:hypothetical protein R5R35_004104 [Gryllus longicercus]|uniref:RNA (guanine-9-)-methyltransferase domain-containing protein 1 n=1 Tax=Gryllus longicercus TaxID=2509291 RepID=A0AAN9Z177_9ORTH